MNGVAAKNKVRKGAWRMPWLTEAIKKCKEVLARQDLGKGKQI